MTELRIETPVAFDWDAGNIDKNWDKHRVTPREAEEVFANRPLTISPNPSHSETELRWVGFGLTNDGRKLALSFAMRGKKLRVIMARDMSKKERKWYEHTT